MPLSSIIILQNSSNLVFDIMMVVAMELYVFAHNIYLLFCLPFFSRQLLVLPCVAWTEDVHNMQIVIHVL